MLACLAGDCEERVPKASNGDGAAARSALEELNAAGKADQARLGWMRPCVLRLQPCVFQATILCIPGCNPVHSRLQSCAFRLRPRASRL